MDVITILTIVGVMIGIAAGIVQIIEYFQKRRDPMGTKPKVTVDNTFEPILPKSAEDAESIQSVLVQLRQLINQLFNDGEIKTLCFDLGVEFESLPGQAKADKARELVAYMERHNRLSELIDYCKKIRPAGQWPRIESIYSTQPKRNRQSEELYLRWLIRHYEDWQSSFADRKFTVQEHSITIPEEMLELLGKEQIKTYEGNLQQVILSGRHYLVLGDPGSGKTTLLEKLAYDKAKIALNDPIQALPVMIRLRDFTSQQSIPEFLHDQMQTPMGTLSTQFFDYLTANRFWLLLDALDEVPTQNYPHAVEALSQFLASYPNITVVLSCRTKSYNEKLDLLKIRVQPLNSKQRQQFILSFLPDKGQQLLQEIETTNYRDLAFSPYFLRMLIVVYQGQGSLPPELELMPRFVDVLLKREQKKALQLDVTLPLLHCVLTHIALEMAIGGYRGTAVSQSWVEQRIPRKLSIEQVEYLVNLETVLDLAYGANLISPGIISGTFRFYHQLLQEYFQERAYLHKEYFFQRLQAMGHDVVPVQNLISQAYKLSVAIDGEKPRFSGHPYVFHDIGVALIAAFSQQPFDPYLIAAALIHDIDVQIIKDEQLEPNIIELVQDVKNFSTTIASLKTCDECVLNELINTFGKRVILLKLSDRLHNMQTVQFIKGREKTNRKIEETREYYVPLARKAGFEQIAQQLETALENA